MNFTLLPSSSVLIHSSSGIFVVGARLQTCHTGIPPSSDLYFTLRADSAMRGFAISFLTLASVASPNSLFVFFFIAHPFSSHIHDGAASEAKQFNSGRCQKSAIGGTAMPGPDVP